MAKKTKFDAVETKKTLWPVGDCLYPARVFIVEEAPTFQIVVTKSVDFQRQGWLNIRVVGNGKQISEIPCTHKSLPTRSKTEFGLFLRGIDLLYKNYSDVDDTNYLALGGMRADLYTSRWREVCNRLAFMIHDVISNGRITTAFHKYPYLNSGVSKTLDLFNDRYNLLEIWADGAFDGRDFRLSSRCLQNPQLLQ